MTVEKDTAYYESLDKRSKEYRDWKASLPVYEVNFKDDEISIGLTDKPMFGEFVVTDSVIMGSKKKKLKLGDKVEKAIPTPIKKAVKAVEKKTGKPCGCEKRKEWLNKTEDKILATINNILKFSYGRSALREMPLELRQKWCEYKGDNRYNKSVQNIDFKDKELIIEIGKQVFARDYRSDFGKCGDCIKYLKVDINRVYETYL